MKKLLILFILCLSSYAHAFNPFVVFSGVPGSETASCTKSVEQTTISSYQGFNTTSGQKLDINSSTTVCKVVIWLRSEYGNTLEWKLQMWSDIDASGTQYGGDSSTETISSSTGSQITFTWSSDLPVLPGDTFLHLINVSGSAGQLQIGFTTYDNYAGTSYNFFVAGAAAGEKDIAFELWTQ